MKMTVAEKKDQAGEDVDCEIKSVVQHILNVVEECIISEISSPHSVVSTEGTGAGTSLLHSKSAVSYITKCMQSRKGDTISNDVDQGCSKQNVSETVHVSTSMEGEASNRLECLSSDRLTFPLGLEKSESTLDFSNKDEHLYLQKTQERDVSYVQLLTSEEVTDTERETVGDKVQMELVVTSSKTGDIQEHTVARENGTENAGDGEELLGSEYSPLPPFVFEDEVQADDWFGNSPPSFSPGNEIDFTGEFMESDELTPDPYDLIPTLPTYEQTQAIVMKKLSQGSNSDCSGSGSQRKRRTKVQIPMHVKRKPLFSSEEVPDVNNYVDDEDDLNFYESSDAKLQYSKSISMETLPPESREDENIVPESEKIEDSRNLENAPLISPQVKETAPVNSYGLDDRERALGEQKLQEETEITTKVFQNCIRKIQTQPQGIYWSQVPKTEEKDRIPSYVRLLRDIAKSDVKSMVDTVQGSSSRQETPENVSTANKLDNFHDESLAERGHSTVNDPKLSTNFTKKDVERCQGYNTGQNQSIEMASVSDLKRLEDPGTKDDPREDDVQHRGGELENCLPSDENGNGPDEEHIVLDRENQLDQLVGIRLTPVKLLNRPPRIGLSRKQKFRDFETSREAASYNRNLEAPKD